MSYESLKKNDTQNTLKEQYDVLINALEGKEQLKGSVNTVNERKEGSDMRPSEFTSGLDPMSDTKPLRSDPEFPLFKEMKRFSKDIPIDEKSLRANEKTPTFGRTDDTASGKVS